MTLTPEKINEIKAQLMGLSPEEQQEKLQEILASLSPEEQEQLVGKQQCPFCSMVSGEIPVKKVYEDADCIAILDIHPASKGHMLLFPKKHYAMVAQMPDNEAGKLFAAANKLSKAAFEALNAAGTNIVAGNGAKAGQRAPHALINIIPRYEDDKVSIGWNPMQVEESEMETIAQTIASKIPAEKLKEEYKPVIKKYDAREEHLRMP
ncbi:MAG: HIT domain-containing protein [Nanoarchaeota archaeon]|nr:HIT domain-containing protein [Nanoarchaeota archaeon]